MQGKVVTDSINGIAVETAVDTLKALSVVTISGHLEDSDGEILTGFNGTVEASVYDKVTHVTTLANDGGTPMTYPVTGSVLFRGSTLAVDGRFSYTFIVPLDINYSYGFGKISYYAANGAYDLNGSYSDIIVGGFSEISGNDTEGPAVRLFMNDTLFREGGITDTAPTLLALLSDGSGINASGTGIGHDIIAWLDDDMSRAVVLNDLYTSNLGVHTSGTTSIIPQWQHSGSRW